MARTIIYPEKKRIEKKAEEPKRRADDLQDKLLKYIPAETIAFFVSIYPLLEKASVPWKIFSAVVALLGTLGYLWIRAPKDNPPRWYFYVLSTLALLGWILGTTTFGPDVLGMPEAASRATLTAMVFLVPLLDEAITRWMNGEG